MPGRVILLSRLDPVPWSAEQLATALARLPAGMGEEVARQRRWQDRQARILGRLLLQAGLTRLGLGPAADLARWTRDRRGRPRLLGCPADFSISHAAGVAVCAVTRAGRLGVDVEPAQALDLHDLATAFGPAEWASIQGSADPSLAALRLWTAKEAALKADGQGLGVEPAGIDARGKAICLEGAVWHLSAPAIGAGWVCRLATAWPDPEIETLWPVLPGLMPSPRPLAVGRGACPGAPLVQEDPWAIAS
jgi:4'-phosphopantetheinyl transferase